MSHICRCDSCMRDIAEAAKRVRANVIGEAAMLANERDEEFCDEMAAEIGKALTRLYGKPEEP